MQRYWVYILANKTRVLYVGVTNDLVRRIGEHQQGTYIGFTRRYNVNRLVYFEMVTSSIIAMQREKQLEVITRAKKIRLIEARNPEWMDLSQGLKPVEDP